jgi:hypothetical protein
MSEAYPLAHHYEVCQNIEIVGSNQGRDLRAILAAETVSFKFCK